MHVIGVALKAPRGGNSDSGRSVYNANWPWGPGSSSSVARFALLSTLQTPQQDVTGKIL